MMAFAANLFIPVSPLLPQMPLEARPGERRIRRIIKWTGADGVTYKREVIINDKNDIMSINVMCQGEPGFSERVIKKIPKDKEERFGSVPARLAVQHVRVAVSYDNV